MTDQSDRDAVAVYIRNSDEPCEDMAEGILRLLAQRGVSREAVNEHAALREHLSWVEDKWEQTQAERDAAVARAEAAERERDAYRKAKQENDERYMTERDAARAEAAALREALTHLQADVNHAICWFSGGGDIHTVVHALTKARDLARQALAGATQQRQGEGS